MTSLLISLYFIPLFRFFQYTFTPPHNPMVRLTQEVIASSPQFVNALKEREIDLHDADITLLEGSAAMAHLAGFDTINLSNNGLSRLEGFPTARHRLIRVKTLHLFGNPSLRHIQLDIAEALPLLETLSLQSCGFSAVSQLASLASLRCLRTLVLAGNPIAESEDYLEGIRALLPNLVYLDFNRLPKHTAESPKKPGKRVKAAKETTARKAPKKAVPSKDSLVERLRAASTAEEIDAVEKLLQKHYPQA